MTARNHRAVSGDKLVGGEAEGVREGGGHWRKGMGNRSYGSYVSYGPDTMPGMDAAAGNTVGGVSGTNAEALAGVDAQLYLHPQTLARLGSLELRAKMIVEGVMSGAHRSPYQGSSVEFAQHRPYVPGDDLRHLDWKVFGRSDKLYLKQHQQETNLDLLVLVDSSGSMAFGSRSFAEASGIGRRVSLDGRSDWSKFDHSTALAAALSYITIQQGDRVGLIVFADAVRAAVRRSSSQGTWRQIVTALAIHPVEEANRGRKTDLPRAVDQILAKVNNRCLVAIVSDFFMDTEELREALARVRHHRHDLMAFQVLDR